MECETPYKKAAIPKALREQVWIRYMGRKFEGRCRVRWCGNTITVFDFQSGHNIPESKGGRTSIENLVPICARCNVSMGNQYTIDEWNRLGEGARWYTRFIFWR
jgi:5-methylcytosine-specific restriction endonuclease McrA